VSIVETIRKFKSEPPDDFIKFVLGKCAVGGRLTQTIVDENREVIRSAMEAFVTQEALARFGYAPKDVVRAPPVEPTTIGAPAVAPEPEIDSPSPGEMSAFNYARNRLYFLVRNEVLFSRKLITESLERRSVSVTRK
jgi:predicted type IV restriction endonuclease